jgi:hypothetical protein
VTAGTDVLGLGETWPRPGWAVLDAARDQAFTGIVEFQTSPTVRVCVDRGRVYLAERVTDPPIGARLVDAGVLTAADLERGTIRVGDVDHLGRLFERVPSIDRFRVLVVVEMMTDEATSWVAAQDVRGAVVRPYDHHVSGIHHWDRERDRTVVLLEGTSPQLPPPLPGSAVLTADLVADVVERPVGDVDALTDDVRIEWADAAWLGSSTAAVGGAGSVTVTAPVVGTSPFDPPVPPLLPEGQIDPDSAAVAFAAAEDVVDGFEVIWPTGEVQRELTVPLDPAGAATSVAPPPPPSLTWNLRMPGPSPEAVGAEADLVDELAEEVAQAVRRAIAAITAGEADVDLDEVLGFDVTPPAAADDGPLIVRASTLTPAETEAAQRLASGDPAAPTSPETSPETRPVPPAPRTQAVVGEPSITPPAPPPASPDPSAGGERAGALRRLIGSLRRR